MTKIYCKLSVECGKCYKNDLEVHEYMNKLKHLIESVEDSSWAEQENYVDAS